MILSFNKNLNVSQGNTNTNPPTTTTTTPNSNGNSNSNSNNGIIFILVAIMLILFKAVRSQQLEPPPLLVMVTAPVVEIPLITVTLSLLSHYSNISKAPLVLAQTPTLTLVQLFQSLL